MLADAVEAATQMLTDPTPARIRGVVQKIINAIFVDGQLDECDLTLRDLHIIANSFVRILTGFFHHRIEYPGGRPGGAPRNEARMAISLRNRQQKVPVETAWLRKVGAKDPARAGAPDGGL